MRLTAIQAGLSWLRRERKAARWLSIGAAVLVIGLGVWLYIAAEDRVCLVADGRATIYHTRSARVESFLHAIGYTLYDGDVVEPGRGEKIKEGMTIRVQRAFPVELVVGGHARQVKTVARPIRDLLRLCRVTLGPEDRVSPALGQEVKPNQTVEVIRVSVRQLTYQEEVSPEIVNRNDPNLSRGSKRVLRPGTPGLVERTALVRFENGRAASRTILSSKWLRWPIACIMAVGIKPIIYSFVTSRGQSVRYTQVLNMTATAYYPGPESCGPNAKGITRTGARATYGVVAVDPRVIPLGTKLYVEGYGFATALDTGSAIKGQKIDLCYDTYREALMYGKRQIRVYILARE